MVECTTHTQRYNAKTRAQRLKRVFKIDMETCAQCGGAVKVIASIEDPLVAGGRARPNLAPTYILLWRGKLRR